MVHLVGESRQNEGDMNVSMMALYCHTECVARLSYGILEYILYIVVQMMLIH